MLYEAYLPATYGTGLLAYYKGGDTASPVVDSSGSGFDSVAVGTGVSFANSNKIPNTALNSLGMSGASAQTFVQLEAAPGSRFRLTNWTLNLWFRRTGTGVTGSTGTGGITAEPLIGKGGAESETAGVNCNFFLGLEALDTNFYLSADFEKLSDANNTTKPIGRNGRMLDVSTSGSDVTLRGDISAGAAAVSHGFAAGDRVRFGGTAITGITAGTWYFVIATGLTSTTWRVSATAGGSAIALGTVAAGAGAWCNHAKGTVVFNPTTQNNTWVMASCTWDGTTLKTFLNGVLAEAEVPTMAPPENTSTQLAALAAYVTSAAARTGAFAGQMQHVSVHSTVLTTANLLDLYNNGTTAAPPAPTGVLISPTPCMPRSTFSVAIRDAVGGGGINDSTVVGSTVVLKRNTVVQTQGTAYTFAYDSTKDRITLTSTGLGAKFPSGTYAIELGAGIANNNGGTLSPTTLTVTVVDLLYGAPDNAIDYGLEWENWLIDSGSTKDETGLKLVQNSTVEFARIDVSGLAASTTYWASITIGSKSAGANGNVRVVAVGTDGSNMAGTAGANIDLTGFVLGVPLYFKIITDSTTGPTWRLALRHATSPDTEWLKITDFRIFLAPARSSAKVVVLGDREGGYDATRAAAVNDAALHSNADAMNVIMMGDTGGSTVTVASANDRLKLGPAGNNGIISRGGKIWWTPGNHDYDANASATGGQIENDCDPYYDIANNNNGGLRYYTAVLGNMEFLIGDDNDNSITSPLTEPNASGYVASPATNFKNSTMGQYLINKANASQKPWRIMCLHHAAYSSSNSGSGWTPNTMGSAGFNLAGQVQVMLQAHLHGVERIYKDGIYYYTCAMGGGNHFGWTTKLAETQFRLEDATPYAGSQLSGYLKISDSPTRLVLEYFDTSHVLWDRVAIEQSRTPVTQTRAVTFDVRAKAGITRAMSYNVRDVVHALRTAIFDVRGRATVTRAVSYHVRDKVATNRAMSFQVRQKTGTKTLTLLYDVRDKVLRQADARFDVRGLATKQVAVIYQVRGKVTKQVGIIYDVDAPQTSGSFMIRLDKAAVSFQTNLSTGPVFASNLIVKRL